MAITHLSDLRLTDTCWDDLKAPAAAIYSPGNTGSGPDRDTEDGTLLFASDATELVHMHFQMPHAWKAGSTISPHLHWMKSSDASGGVVWKMRYKWCEIGDTFPAYSDLDTAVEKVSAGDLEGIHGLYEFSEITDADKTLSSMIIVELSRVHDATADTYAADAKLLEFDIHYQIDSLGSSDEYVKG